MLPERITVEDAEKFTPEQWEEWVANNYEWLTSVDAGVNCTITAGVITVNEQEPMSDKKSRGC